MNWISVDDELPPDEQVVLCKQIWNNNLMLCYIIHAVWRESYEDIKSDDVIRNDVAPVGDSQHYLRITHWMPLPEPPDSKQ